MQALEGIRVLDLSRTIIGTFCTMILGDFGAEVIKVEVPPQAGERSIGVITPDRSPIDEAGRKEIAFYSPSRNKKSIAINISTEEGRQIFYKLAEEADCILEALRPGVTKRLGIDYETISKLNPRVVYCSITGYGQDGPYCDLPGHDGCYLATSGILGLIGERDRKPVVPLNLVGDLAGGALHAAIGSLLALMARERTGKGQHVDISMTDAAVSLLWAHSMDYFSKNVIAQRGVGAMGGAFPYHNIYEAKDGKLVFIACIEPWFWERLCRELGREDFIPYHFSSDHLLSDPEGEKWPEIFAFLKEAFLTKSRDEWFEQLRQKDIPVAKVQTIDEVFSDPQVLHRQMVVEVDHPTAGKVRQTGIPIKLGDTPGEVRSLSPLLGGHTETILLDLGYGEKYIRKLREEGVVY